MLEDSVMPEEAAAAFEKHCRQLAEKATAPLLGTGLLFDLYHPISLLRRFDLRSRLAQRNAEVFLQDVREGRYGGLCLRAPPTNPGNRQRGVCTTAGHLLAPHFAYDPDVDSVQISCVPASMSVWEFCDTLTQCRGLVALSWPWPRPGEATRKLRAHYSTGSLARGALNALGTMEVARAALIVPQPEISALVIPPEMSHPERLSKDGALASRVVRVLDGLVGVRTEFTEQLLSQEQSPEEKLDLLVLYLRRVHHFCFYAAAWCDDEWNLRKRCGSAVLRDTSTDAPEGEWAAAHEARLLSFLANPGGKRPTVPSRDEEPIAGRVAKVQEEQTKQVTEGKFRCLQCGKHFKGPDYVHKHLRKVHTDVLEAVRQKVLEEAAREACLADPGRPSIPVTIS